MRNFILICIVILLASCTYGNHSQESNNHGINKAHLVHDTIQMHDTILVTIQCDYTKYLRTIDSIQIVNDTLARRLLHSRLVIQNVKYYLNICIQKPSQDKFLKGWIRRALNN